MTLEVGAFLAPRRRGRKAKAGYRGHNGLNAAPAGEDPPIRPHFIRRRARQPPKTTLFMIRPGASVNKPVTTSARVKIQIIVWRRRRTSCWRARRTASGTTPSVNNDRRWMGLQDPQVRIVWMKGTFPQPESSDWPRPSRSFDAGAFPWGRETARRRERSPRKRKRHESG